MPAAKPDPYKNEALIWEHFDTTIRLHDDGTGERIVHIVVRLQSEGAARQFSVLSVPYASAYETGNIDFIRVHKPDGTTVETPTADAIEMPAAVTREAPLYSDLKEKQLPVRSVASGDLLDYQLRSVRTKAEAPGQFWGSEHFLIQGGVVLSQTLTLEVPAAKYVQIWDPNHPAKPTAHDGVLTYTWTSSQLKPTSKPQAAGTAAAAGAAKDEIKDPDEDADGRSLPSVAWTTFHSWAEVGDWYRGLAQDRVAPTTAIRARAEELTKNAKTPDEQVRALYDFVSSKTRYVGIDFGVGRYQPHTADEVMDHQYGDCKDKDTLLESLLRAKGFTTAPALIGVNIAPVADLPSPALFNHVITTVEMPGVSGKPAERIWLDTTPEVEPYRVLIPFIRDEQALVIPASGAASLQRTPADPPFPYSERFTADGSIDKDGLLKSRMEMTLRSDNELGFRLLLERAAPSQWDAAMQSVSGGMGFGGTVTNTNLKQTDPAGPVHITYDYSRASYADWDHLRILPLFPYLEITTIDKETAPEHDIDQGTLRTLEATTRIQLPDGYRAELPDAVHVKRDYATFDKTYKLEKDELIVDRKTVILKKKIPKAEWKDYLAYTKSVGMNDGENYIVLTAPPMALPALDLSKPMPAEARQIPVPANASSPPTQAGTDPAGADSKENSRAQRAMLESMMKEARQLELDGKWKAAAAMLAEVKSKDSNFPYLSSVEGEIAMHNGKPQEAIQDYESEVSNDPHDAPANVVIPLADAYVSQKRYAEAEFLLRKYQDRNDAGIVAALARAQTSSGDDTAALQTLLEANAAHPHDRIIEMELAGALHRAHREREAAAQLKSLLLESSEPGSLNDGSYMLANMKLELPLAESSSRRAIRLLEDASVKGDIQEVNNSTFARTNTLLASWDTLAWILYEEGKPTEAEPYARAAWLNRTSLVVGDHLGQILEALGKPSEALSTYQMAMVTDGATAQTQLATNVRMKIDRLTKAGTPAGVGDPSVALARLRAFPVSANSHVDGQKIFRVLIGLGGIVDSRLVDADGVRSVTPTLTQLKIPGAVPPGSSGRLLRDGVLSCPSEGATCEFVLMPRSGLSQEGVQ